jgi:hypothetical protein
MVANQNLDLRPDTPFGGHEQSGAAAAHSSG